MDAATKFCLAISNVPTPYPGTELKNNWAPNEFWDDWLQESNTCRGRQGMLYPSCGFTMGKSSKMNVFCISSISLFLPSVHWRDNVCQQRALYIKKLIQMFTLPHFGQSYQLSYFPNALIELLSQ